MGEIFLPRWIANTGRDQILLMSGSWSLDKKAKVATRLRRLVGHDPTFESPMGRARFRYDS
jgi:hypothetical protein